MKTDASLESLGPGPDPDEAWLEAVASGRLTPDEAGRLRQALAGRPDALRRLDQELALNALLDDRSRAPGTDADFVARVLQRLGDGEAAVRVRGAHGAGAWGAWVRGLWAWAAGPRWALAAAALALILSLGWRERSRRQRDLMAASVAEMALTATTPGLSAEALEDYEAIRRLGAADQPADEALIAALVEGPRP